MIPLDRLSPVGFGAYRVSHTVETHRDALAHAFDLGCNHVDTAPHYGHGSSELLIGEQLAGDARHDVFVVTKVGYVDGHSLDALGSIPEGDVVLDGGRPKYVLNPRFFQAQLDGSCRRLRRDHVDAVLLHNPEHALDARSTTAPPFLDRVAEVFAWFEDRVAAGQISCYGVSSNRFLGPPRSHPLALEALVDLAAGVNGDHRFRLVQFPYNLLEDDAGAPGDDGVSLIDRATALGLVSFANRPLNAITPDGAVRLATYADPSGPDAPADDAAMSDLVRSFDDELRRRGVEGGAGDFPVLTYLAGGGWRRLGSPEAVDDVFRSHVYPLLEAATEGDPDRPVWAAAAGLHRAAEVLARRGLTRRAASVRAHAVEVGAIAVDDVRPLPAVLCERYLRAGIGHVLMGMRRREYVEEMRAFF